MDDAREALLEQLKQSLVDRVMEGSIPLPTIPKAVSEALRQLEQQEPDLVGAMRSIESDPGLSARVLRLANSAAYGGATINSLQQAAMRIGGRALRSLLYSVAGERAFASNMAEINASMRALWRHCLATAQLCRALARYTCSETDHAGVEGAYLAGLLHDIGKPISAAFLIETENRLIGRRTVRWLDPDEWLGLIRDTHQTAGLLVAAEWNLPVPVREGIANANTYNEAEPRTIANVVRLANNLTKKEGVFLGSVDIEHVEELIAEGLALLHIDAGEAYGLAEVICADVQAQG